MRACVGVNEYASARAPVREAACLRSAILGGHVVVPGLDGNETIDVRSAAAVLTASCAR